MLFVLSDCAAQFGVKPFQGSVFDFPVRGMLLVQSRSGIRYTNSQGIATSRRVFKSAFA